jgi:hypothetical protein
VVVNLEVVGLCPEKQALQMHKVDQNRAADRFLQMPPAL